MNNHLIGIFCHRVYGCVRYLPYMGFAIITGKTKKCNVSVRARDEQPCFKVSKPFTKGLVQPAGNAVRPLFRQLSAGLSRYIS